MLYMLSSINPTTYIENMNCVTNSTQQRCKDLDGNKSGLATPWYVYYTLSLYFVLKFIGNFKTVAYFLSHY